MQWEVPTLISEVVGTGALLITLFYIAKQIVIQSDQLKRSNDHQSAQYRGHKNHPLYITPLTRASEHLCD